MDTRGPAKFCPKSFERKLAEFFFLILNAIFTDSARRFCRWIQGTSAPATASCSVYHKMWTFVHICRTFSPYAKKTVYLFIFCVLYFSIKHTFKFFCFGLQLYQINADQFSAFSIAHLPLNMWLSDHWGFHHTSDVSLNKCCECRCQILNTVLPSCASISLHRWGGDTQWPINSPLLSSSHSPSFPPPPERCKVSQQVWNRVMNWTWTCVSPYCDLLD